MVSKKNLSIKLKLSFTVFLISRKYLITTSFVRSLKTMSLTSSLIHKTLPEYTFSLLETTFMKTNLSTFSAIGISIFWKSKLWTNQKVTASITRHSKSSV